MIAIGVSLDKPAVDPERRIAALNESREEIFKVPVYSKPSIHHVGICQPQAEERKMTRKQVEESHNQTDVRYIRNNGLSNPIAQKNPCTGGG